MDKDELCSVCGRPPHPCDDPECIPANKPLAEQLAEAKRIIQALTKERDSLKA